jgi:hypothetical protein
MQHLEPETGSVGVQPGHFMTAGVDPVPPISFMAGKSDLP